MLRWIRGGLSVRVEEFEGFREFVCDPLGFEVGG